MNGQGAPGYDERHGRAADRRRRPDHRPVGGRAARRRQSSPIDVIGRVSRLSRLIDRRLAENFARFGLEDWMYDVLATLRRRGEPYELTAGELVRQSMVTTGAITNRIDRLEQRGLRRADRARPTAARSSSASRPPGLALVDRSSVDHMADGGGDPRGARRAPAPRPRPPAAHHPRSASATPPTHRRADRVRRGW